jgi:hypothetical protein
MVVQNYGRARKGSGKKLARSHFKNKQEKQKNWAMVQVVDCILMKHKVLTSFPNITHTNIDTKKN